MVLLTKTVNKVNLKTLTILVKRLICKCQKEKKMQNVFANDYQSICGRFYFSKTLCFQHILMKTFSQMRLNNENCSLRRILFQMLKQQSHSLRKRCTYSELFWSVIFSIWTQYGEVRSISSYSVRMWENTDQNNSEYEHFSHNDYKSLIA